MLAMANEDNYCHAVADHSHSHTHDRGTHGGRYRALAEL